MIGKEFDIETYLRNIIFKKDDSLFEEGTQTLVENVEINGNNVNKFTNEFWTAKQRQASPIHEVSYRACFKPQLPRFFIEVLTLKNDIVYDPFSGRGTTVIEAGLLGRNIIANDINPLSCILSKPRFFIPSESEIVDRLESIKFYENLKSDIDLSMFYHEKTLSEILSLRNYLIERQLYGNEDHVDSWIRMIATNRLTGHSSGYFSVYTLPPNQAVSSESQIKINQKRDQIPDYRDVKKMILKKSDALIKNLDIEYKSELRRVGENAVFLNSDAGETKQIESDSVKLVVTSPPFLDVVKYSNDNWLRCWFNNIDAETVAKKITMSKTIEEWTAVMSPVFAELYRILQKDGHVAFEVGEVKNSSLRLDEYVVEIGIKAGFKCIGIMINKQEFTKTANIWGVSNNGKGTNTNRIVIFRK